MNTAIVALRLLRREWRSGDITVVITAIVVAVTALVSVTTFSDRLREALRSQGSELLAADVVVRTPYPPNPVWLERATELDLQHVVTVGFRSVVTAEEASRLAEVKAVAPGYPLRGTMRTADGIDQEDRPADGVPSAGKAWIDQQLLAALKIDIGQKIQLGYRLLTVDQIITLEPDRGGSVFSIGPRLMISSADLPSTGLLAPGSLVSYRWLLAGDATSLAEFRRWLEAQNERGLRIEDASNAQPRFRTALNRGERFLGLATLVSVLLAGIAIVRAARHYTTRHMDTVAIIRCFGSTQRQIVEVFTIQLLVIGGLASAVGCALGYLAQQVFVYILPGLVAAQLPLPTARPALIGMLAGITTLVGFAAPVVLRLKHVPPLRVFRREIGALPKRLIMVYATAVATLSTLVIWLGRDLELSMYVLGGGLLTVIVLNSVSHLMVRAVNHFSRGVGASWRFGISNLARRADASISQIVAIGIGVMAILLLSTVRSDLLQAWRSSLPVGTPNHFLINIQPGQLSRLEAFFHQRGWPPPTLRPIVRARLVSINDKPVKSEDFVDGFARRMVQRAANLSWTEELQEDNKVVSGKWWTSQESAAPLVSVEQQYANALGLKLGDVLTYQIADRYARVRITNLRSVEWDSFRPNFFLIVPPKLLAGYPTSYITSIYVPKTDTRQLRELVGEFPNITDIDIDALLEQVRRLVDRVNLALQYIFLFTLLAGFTVLYAAIQTSKSERRREIAVLRALGATQRQLLAGVAAEFFVSGLLAGGIGALAAMAVGFGIAEYLFNLPYRFNFAVWWMGLTVSGVAVTAFGILGTYRLWRTPPWLVLQEA